MAGMEGLDRWITGNYGGDQFKDVVCPHDGTASEDMGELDHGWQCPTCDRILADDDLITLEAYVRDLAGDEPQDLDERRDADD